MDLIFKMIRFKTVESEMTFLLKNGYVNKEGRPLKCLHCEGTKFESRNEQYMETAGLCEYELFCKECGNFLGSWSYGYWDWMV